MMRTNVDSCYFLAKALGPLLKAAGATAGGPAARIVNVASVAGVTSSGTGIVYGMSKAAMVQMSRGLACEWAKHNVRVNTVAPWMTMTPLLEEALKANPNQLEKVGEMKHSSTTLSNSFPLYLSPSLPLCLSASLPLCPSAPSRLASMTTHRRPRRSPSPFAAIGVKNLHWCINNTGLSVCLPWGLGLRVDTHEEARPTHRDSKRCRFLGAAGV